MHLLTRINRCNALVSGPDILNLLDSFWMRFPVWGKCFFSILKKKPLAECCGQTKQKTEKFTVHRCTAVQDGSKNSSQRVMADCGLWLSGGISSSDKDKPLHYAEKSIFFDDTVWNCCCCSCSCYWCVCLSVCPSVHLSVLRWFNPSVWSRIQQMQVSGMTPLLLFQLFLGQKLQEVW